MKKRLTRKLIFHTLLFSLVLTLMLSGIQLYSEYRQNHDAINNELAEIEHSTVSSLEQAAWLDDHGLLKILLDGITAHPYIASAEIRLESGATIRSTGHGAPADIQLRHTLQHHYNGKSITLGQLTITATLDSIHQHLIDRSWQIVVSNAILIILLATFMFQLFSRLITHPLAQIASFAVSDDGERPPLDLGRDQRKQDELDSVVDSINTMRARLQQLLDETRTQKDYLDLTLNSIGDAVITTDNQGRISRMNPAAERITGWQESEALGQPLKTVFEIFDASTGEPIVNPVEIVLHTGETVYLSNHTTLKAKDGSEHQIADSAAPIMAQDGKQILGIVLVFNDVTEAYRLREAARSTQEQLQALLDDMQTSVGITDPDGTLVFVNNTPLKLAGLRAEAVIGRKIWDTPWFDYSEATQLHIQTDCARAAAGECVSHDIQIQTRDGLHWIDFSIHPVHDEHGKVVQLVTEGRDISLRKQVEERLELALKSSKAGLWDWDIRHDKVFYDELWCNLLGYRKEELGEHIEVFASLLHPDDRDATMAQIDAHLQGEAPAYEAEFRMRHKSGEWRWMFARGEVVELDIKGRPARMIGAMLDTSQQKMQEELLLRSRKMDALGKLTGGVAHDFNNILGVIMGYADMLKKQADDSQKVIKYATTIYNASQRGAKLTRKMLAFSRQMPAESSVVHVNKLLQEEKNVIQKALTSRIELEMDLADNIWLVKLDASELEDAILNLSINAMHAIDGHGKFTIHTQNRLLQADDARELGLDGREFVLLRFCDTGCGMTPEVLDNIFDPFFTTKGENGTGLGLSQIYGFVQRSGGAIHVTSTPGEGSCFDIYLPRYQTSDEITVYQPPSSSASSDGGNATILVVDDETELADITGEILRGQGYRVHIAHSADAALAILAREPVDLLLSDVIMPKTDGFQLAQAASEKYPKLKIQLMSGYHKEGETPDEPPFAADILYKPVQAETLLERVASLLQGKDQ